MDDEALVDPEYMGWQPDLTDMMRVILVDWLISVHWAYQFVPETLHMTVNLIDRYLQQHQRVYRSSLQLVGATCLWIAAQEQEIFPLPVEELVYLCDGAFTAKQFKDMEISIRITPAMLLPARPAYAYLVAFLQETNADSRVTQLSNYLIDGTLLNLCLAKYSPRKLAAACLWMAQCSLGVRRTRGDCHGFTRDELTLVCSDILRAKFSCKARMASGREICALQDKYGSERFDKDVIDDTKLRYL